MVNFSPSPGTGDLYDDPDYVDPLNNNFALNASSTMIGAGQYEYDMGGVPYTVRPLMPSDLEIVTIPDEFNVTISWTNPSENSDGTTITSLNGVKIYRNGELIADMNGMTPGAYADFNDVVPIQDNYRYRIIAYTDIDGLYSFTRSQWIGPNISSLPTGPDAYGYSALESSDPDGPAFDWLEIAPTGGGPGAVVSELTGQDDHSAVVDLPFSFQYYGMTYDQITICTNGWLAMGDAQSEVDWSNTGIPNADGPPAMLAPFWEDLNLEHSGEIATFYYVVGGTFIVEFYQVPQWSPETALETFQVILYDPAVHTTVTGDGMILFQWHTVSDPSEATFGIENQAEAVGLQLGLNNSFDPTLLGVQNDYAVLFTPPDENFPVAVTLTPESPPVVIPAAGGSFNYTLDLSAPVNTETFDVWIDVVMPNGSLYGPVISRNITLQTGVPLTRDMTQNVPSGAPEGEYTYRSFIGDEALGLIWSIDTFTFAKEGVTDGSGGSWACTEGTTLCDGIPVNASVAEYIIHSNSPNPFNPMTTISFALPEASRVSLNVYNSHGSRVATLVDGWRAAGAHELTFDGSNLSSGVYIYQLQAGEFVEAGKMLLLK
ncbi:hypothetical protein CEE37_11635 [candidate division LCP-89 bacterium B3_LCP]|uniref:Secretion system C-terminal sorting domain-containing protein n=1 Tax=candidate division LCP-89 bacterium B3_LCP TaxID=2012998 RepID=A0A532UVV2_UNCL8|nr:MAG: hypothetical protein CEE37_11635 [candidate division LCP-89 bacterium B3_LCP]